MSYRPSNATPRFVAPNLDPNLIARPSQDISGGLEQLFNSYMAIQQNKRAQLGADNQSALAQQQLGAGQRAAALQGVSDTADFGAPISTFTPQQIQQAATPATSQDQQMAQDQQDRANPMMAHLRAGIQDMMSKKKTSESLQQGLTQSEINKNNAAAGRVPGGGVQLNPMQSAALQWGIHQGFVAPDELTSRGPKTQILADGISGRQDFKDWYKGAQATGDMGLQDFNPRAQDTSFGAQKAGAAASSKLTEGGSSQIVARAANSAKEQLGILQEASNAFPRSDIRFMNTAINAIDSQKYPEAQNWKVALNSARMEYATALNRGQSPTEEIMKEARIALPDNITPAQLPGAIKMVSRGLDATVRGQMTPAGAKTSTPSAKGSDPLGIL